MVGGSEIWGWACPVFSSLFPMEEGPAWVGLGWAPDKARRDWDERRALGHAHHPSHAPRDPVTWKGGPFHLYL